MRKEQLITEAILKAKLGNPYDPDNVLRAKIALEDAIRRYSANGALTAFQQYVECNLNEGETCFGRPTLVRGKRLHHRDRVADLPSLTGYNPSTNNMGFVGGRDYIMVADYKKLYTITSVGSSYQWSDVYNPEEGRTDNSMIESNPDVWIWNFDDIIDIVGISGSMTPINMSQWWRMNKPNGHYVASTGMGNFIKVTAHAERNAKVIYNESLDVDKLGELNLPYLYVNLLKLAISYAICDVDEDIERIGSELKAVEDQILSANTCNFDISDFYI